MLHLGSYRKPICPYGLLCVNGCGDMVWFKSPETRNRRWSHLIMSWSNIVCCLQRSPSGFDESYSVLHIDLINSKILSYNGSTMFYRAKQNNRSKLHYLLRLVTCIQYHALYAGIWMSLMQGQKKLRDYRRESTLR